MSQRRRRILVTTDFSSMLEPLITHGADQARQSEGEVIVLHVFGPQEYAQVFKETKMALDEFMQKLCAEMRYRVERIPISGIPIQCEVAQGRSTTEQILATAQALKADLIVVGTHGRTGVRRAVLGSVAEEVLRHAPCPVLVVPIAVAKAEQRLAEVTA